MLFRRKNPPDWKEKTRVMLWPRRSWSRSGRYVAKRILRLTASPHAVAAGVAAGVFASFTPFIGFHFLIAFLLAYLVAGNLLASALGTFFGNPLSFPIIWASTYATGKFVLSGSTNGEDGQELQTLADADWMELGFSGVFELILGLWEPVFLPMLIGAVPLGIPFAISAYLLTRWASSAFRKARAKRMKVPMATGTSANFDNVNVQ